MRISALVGLLALVLSGCASSDQSFSKNIPINITPSSTKTYWLSSAKTLCASDEDSVIVEDSGLTMIIDGIGEEDIHGVNMETVSCILGLLDIPDSVVSKMNSTRAIDGRQQDNWNEFEASWIYHPDDGLDIIIEQKS